MVFKNSNGLHLAFTLIELVFVVSVAGILAVSIIPRMERDALSEMAEQVLSHIRYTQHMAMHDNVYVQDRPDWFMGRWQLNFINTMRCGLIYRVGSDQDLSSGTGDFESSEAALDPLTRDYIYNMAPVCQERRSWFPGVLLKEKYSIISVVSSCATQSIAFDHLGRPYTGVGGLSSTDKLMHQNCEYTFTDIQNRKIKITVTAETGYAFITYID